ncbi:MAG: 50S ribosomal protein L13, partial [Verrucomicrobia bacterium]|nr:50S ribosomal protein L13 [Verrucomicrobiota bacterium]
MATITRKTYSVDASGKILGRLATDIAMHLMGKTSASFLPNVDAGDNVVVTNVEGIKVTGKKYEEKKYYRHSGQPGGLKTKTIDYAEVALVVREIVEGPPFNLIEALAGKIGD